MKQKLFFLIVFLLSVSIIAASSGSAKEKASSRSIRQEKGREAQAPVPRGERSTLAVLRFINASSRDIGDKFQPWEYGIAAMITTDLEQTSMFNLVDRMRLNDILREHDMQQAGLTDPATALAVGKLLTARYILTGTFMVVGKDLRINVQVFSVEKGIQLGAASAKGRVDKFFLVEKEIFTKVAGVLRVMLGEEQQARIMKAVETKSVDASLKNYSGETALMKAEDLKKEGRSKAKEAGRLEESAKQYFEQALQYDPEYERAKTNIANMVNAIPMTL